MCWPTWRIPRPIKNRSSETCLLRAMASRRRAEDRSANPSSSRSCSGLSRYRSERSFTRPWSTNCADRFLTQSVDIERGLRREVFDGTFQLGRTGGLTCAVEVGAFSCHGRTAYRAVMWHVKRIRPDFIRDGDTLSDRRNDIPCALDSNRVAYADVLSGHLIGIVQGGSADGDPAYLHRLQKGERGQGSGPADGDGNVLYLRDFLARRKLEGDGPTRASRFHSQLRSCQSLRSTFTTTPSIS